MRIGDILSIVKSWVDDRDVIVAAALIMTVMFLMERL